MNKIKNFIVCRKMAVMAFLITCTVVGAMGYRTARVAAAAESSKNVMYVYDSGYSNYVGLDKDPVYNLLAGVYNVSVFDVKNFDSEVGAKFTESLKYNDLVFLAEAIGGTHKFGLKCKDLVGQVPIVSLKSFFYTSGRWGWGAPANPTKGADGWNKVKVNADYIQHPIFSGITLAADNTIALYDGTAKDQNNVQSFDATAAEIVNDPILATNGANAKSAIHEHQQADGKNGYLMIAMSNDAITTITDDAKTLILNAVSYEIATSTEYTVPDQVATPVITENDGTVTITCATEGATIYYGINNNATMVGETYSKPVELKQSSTVYAVALKDGMMPSAEASEAFKVAVNNGLGVITGPTVLDPEKLDRGLVAYKTDEGILVSWRLLAGDDVVATKFNVYRNGAKITDSPLSYGTNYLDKQGTVNDIYKVEVVGGETSKEVPALPEPYLNIPLDRPAGGTLEGIAYTYYPGDCSVGDVDADGEYEIFVKWQPTNYHDNSEGGITGNVYIDCYKLNGQKLWRIDLGQNIRAGEHYTQYMVYDFDQDGKAELICKTAPGTKDGNGKNVIMNNDDPNADYRKTYSGKTGIVITGPEYLTVFNGETGAEITTVAYDPPRSITSSWGDSYGNRSERYLACVAYLDGERPSAVFCRGYYTAAYVCAWDFDGKNLTQKWLHSSTSKGSGLYGEGAHSIAVADVDQDGKDEIIFGSACLDHDGKLLYRTGFGHGDALHVADLDPDRPGLEVFMVHEEKGKEYPYDCEMRDALTGEVIWGLKQSGQDIGRGLAADCDSTSRGYEMWPIGDYSNGSKANAVFDCEGNLISSKRPSVNFRVYWTDNLYDEILDGGVITKWVNRTTSPSTVVNLESKYVSCGTVNGTKNVPCLSADILGDWREEVILYDEETCSNLLVFMTTFTSGYRIPTLMHDHTYRMSICWQNVAYNQPPHLGYYLPDYGYNIIDKISGKTGIIETNRQITDVDASYYNLQGQQVTTPKKGNVYINKGKKIIY